MNKLMWSVATLGIVAASSMTFAADAMMMKGDASDQCMMDHMKKMDTNGDGMISKDEYMVAMAKHWEMMHKSKGDMVSMDDMKTSMQQQKADCEKMNMSR